jgi:DNA-binding NarL/FixJ family response regulator
MTPYPTGRPSFRLIIADDQPLVRAGLRTQLEPLGLLWLGEAWDFSSLCELLKSQRLSQPVDLVLLDLKMPGMSGTHSVRDLAQRFPEVAFLIITGDSANKIWRDICKEGTPSTNLRGIVGKSQSAADLRASIDLALAGNLIPLPTDESPNSSLTLDASHRDKFSNGLSPRQMQVAMLVIQGLKNQQVAERLQITEGTVKTYLKEIFRKVGVSNRTELAYQLNLVSEIQ